MADSPPYSSYAAIASTFAGGLLGAAALARRLGRDPRDLTTLDLVVLVGATFKLSRTVAHDRVASFVREPFVEGNAADGPERPAGEGSRRAIGELVTCTRCVGTWIGAGLVCGHVLAPRLGRLATWGLGAAAANDFLQAGFVALTQAAKRLERSAGPASA